MRAVAGIGNRRYRLRSGQSRPHLSGERQSGDRRGAECPHARSGGPRTGRTRFIAIDGRAEETGLETGSIDFVTAGQAFHWFDPGPARAEFLRILRPGGWCVLVWNERHRRSAFLDEYEQLLIRYGNDYAEIRDKRNSAMEVERFFEPQSVDRREFTYTQQFDFAGLSGRLFSSSYAPKPGDAGYEPILRGLRDVFDRFSRNGLVAFDYETFLYYGRLA